MAGPAGAPRSRLIRGIAIAIIALIVLVGIVVLAVWLAIRPKSLVYSIEDGSVHGYDMKFNSVNASFYFLLRVYNPNHKMSVFYDSMQVTVLYEDEPIAFDVVEPFFQRHHNATSFQLKPVARSAPLLASSARQLRVERTFGGMKLTIKVKARIRFKVGSWKSSKRTLWVTCPSVDLHFPPSKSFQKIECKTET